MKTNRKERPQARNKINDPYYQSRHWKIIRVKALNRDRYQCQEHKDAGMIEPANVVDHVVPIKDGGSYELFNLRSLCISCHAKKSAREKRF
jgi:5-methylcytosine-specific restriction enzyme A